MRKLHVSAVCLLSLSVLLLFCRRTRQASVCGAVCRGSWSSSLLCVASAAHTGADGPRPDHPDMFSNTTLVKPRLCVFLYCLYEWLCLCKGYMGFTWRIIWFFGFSWLSSNNRKTNLNYSWKLLSRFVLRRFLETISHKVTEKKT